VFIATEAIDRLHSTANSHKRIIVIEVMGHNAGWIALYAGLAGGGDVILLPELELDMDIVARYLEDRAYKNKDYSIVVVAEGVSPKRKKKSAAEYVAKMISEKTGLETRETVLGYVQRGGTPSPMDRILATRYGAAAVELIAGNDYGKMVTLQSDNIIPVPLEEIAGKLKVVTEDHPLVVKARGMGTCFGSKESEETTNDQEK
jgi:6-phosphofructokinase 1